MYYCNRTRKVATSRPFLAFAIPDFSLSGRPTIDHAVTASVESQASPVRVFISYSHDSREHCDQVLALAQQLRRDGIDAEPDQFHQDELLHWQRWCEEQLRPENSKHVLCVCSAEYSRRVEAGCPPTWARVFWEAMLEETYNPIYGTTH